MRTAVETHPATAAMARLVDAIFFVHLSGLDAQEALNVIGGWPLRQLSGTHESNDIDVTTIWHDESEVLEMTWMTGVHSGDVTCALSAVYSADAHWIAVPGLDRDWSCNRGAAQSHEKFATGAATVVAVGTSAAQQAHLQERLADNGVTAVFADNPADAFTPLLYGAALLTLVETERPSPTTSMVLNEGGTAFELHPVKTGMSLTQANRRRLVPETSLEPRRPFVCGEADQLEIVNEILTNRDWPG